MALTPEEIKKRQRTSGSQRWKNIDTATRSEMMRAIALQQINSLTKEQRSERARKAAFARWGK